MPASASFGQEMMYQVRMDGDEGTLLPVFYADELELVE
jgi:hypothetical protein